jgi:30S ribosomal protein S31
MGKGDKKTAKGKRIMGSYGVSRQKKKDTYMANVAGGAKPSNEAPDAAPKKEAVKKPAVKKPAAEKPAAEKIAAPKKTTKKEEKEA